MGHSLVRMVRSSCRMVALFALLSMVPAAAGAGTVYYDSDYSSYIIRVRILTSRATIPPVMAMPMVCGLRVAEGPTTG